MRTPQQIRCSQSCSALRGKPPQAPKQAGLPADATLRITDLAASACAPSPGDGSSRFGDGSGIIERVGLRRCTMLYRLLSQVPEDVLSQELAHCGITSNELDQEGLIEAVLEQLA